MNKTTKHILYMSAALGMLIYAVPRLSIGEGWTLPTIFSALWLLFALAIVASHLHAILRVDEEMDAQLDRVKKHRRRQLAQLIERRLVRRGQ
ncbi:hypothetical protein FE782_16875 [Paenibacillus antri]|uniref:Uncharacterized protein n=1 Tax=Paenibacillus antri TaxID=2582848 RepID=A0A5R9G3W1_9BACL|nr:hypothetical protein [Paenibacillus antri]TLS51062.1 hypothetical protein FE782_16875 [Paenibacillus antri]